VGQDPMTPSTGDPGNPAPDAAAAGWSAIVYGRTRGSDRWWQAVPEGLDQSGWLGDTVRSAVAGGLELDGQPRFLLAQSSTHRIVGVACQAAELSASMHSDGDRELFCFVGWAAPMTAERYPQAPELDDLRHSYREWLAPIYTEVMKPVWKVQSILPVAPQSTYPGPAPWDGADNQTGASHPGPAPGKGMWAKQSWPDLWAAAEAAGKPLVCVIGWQRANSIPPGQATHLGVADAVARPEPAQPVFQPETVLPVQSPSVSVRPGDEPPADQSWTIEPEFGEDEPGSWPDNTVRGGENGKSLVSGFLPGRTGLRTLPRPAQLAGAGVGVGVGIIAVIILVVVVAHRGKPPTPASQGKPLASASQVKPSVRASVSTSPTPVVTATPPPGYVTHVFSKGTKNHLLRYFTPFISPGPDTLRMVKWVGSFPVTDSGCSARLTNGQGLRRVIAYNGLALCLKLRGQPATFAVAKVSSVRKFQFTLTVLTWQ
jgi:hypothetical protein